MAPLSWCVPCSTSDIIGRKKERERQCFLFWVNSRYVWLCSRVCLVVLGFTLGRFFGIPFICKRGNTDSKIRDLSFPDPSLLQRASAGDIYKDLWFLALKHLCRHPLLRIGSQLQGGSRLCYNCFIASVLHCTLSTSSPGANTASIPLAPHGSERSRSVQ